MAILGTQALTIADWRSRMNPDGNIDFIIEALEQSNPIINQIRWLQGNLPTGNKTTLRTSIPRPSIRRINRGVDAHKSTTKQVQDTCMMLEDRSEVDVKLISIQPDKEGFRRSEDAAFVMGFGDMVAESIFYGDTAQEPDTFNGLSVRYNVIGGEKHSAGHQVIYPKHSKLGLQSQDLGECDAQDAQGKKYRALVTLFDWDVGIAVQDIEANALVRNIDVSKLMSLKSAEKQALVEKFIIAKNRIRNLQNKDKKVHLYVSPAMYDFFEIYLLDKNNVHVTRQDLQNAPTQLYLSGIPIEKSDSIFETEPAFAKV